MALKQPPPRQKEPARRTMSNEEFRRWAGEDTHAEWVDGEVFVFVTAKRVHQLTASFLSELLGTFIRLFQLGQMVTAPYEMKLQQDRSRR